MRLLITGSRAWSHPTLIWQDLEQVHTRVRAAGGQLTVVHGDAAGAARVAAFWCRQMASGAGEEAHPVPREAWAVSRRAGHLRNAHMVNLGADLCHAYITPCTKPGCRRTPKPHPTHGTWNCMQIARAAGIHVVERWQP